ncbi:MAG: DUF1800 domain-containing protein [Ilumatobacteraceae bacterium]
MASDPTDIAHLLRRSGFFADGARIDQLSRLSWAAAVDAVLDTSAAPGEDLPGEVFTWDQNQGWPRYISLVHWWLNRCVSTPTPIVEKMTLFWHGHFTTSFDKVYNVSAIVSQHRLYRAHALGNFATLAQAMAVEPAMLAYLDNSDNVAESPNQNFARELLELYLLGVGNYSEDDVVSAARAWTGHGVVAWNDLRYVFRPEEHDSGVKTFFGTTKNWDGPDIIAAVLGSATKRTISAKFIAKKLWEFFAYEQPSDEIVAAIATSLLAGWSIRDALRTLFNRPEFRSTAARQGHVRSPIEFVVATMHHTGLRAEEAHPEWHLRDMGQLPFNPPNVSGWKHNGYWVNSSAFQARTEFARNVMWVLGNNHGWRADIDTMSVDQAIDHGAEVFDLSLSAPTRAAIRDWLIASRAGTERWAQKYFMTLALLLAPEMHLA